MEAEQRGPHAGLFGDGGSHGVLDDVQGLGAGLVVEFGGELSRDESGREEEEQGRDAAGTEGVLGSEGILVRLQSANSYRYKT